MLRQPPYLALALLAQHVANGREQRRDHAVEQVMPAHIHISCLRRETESEQLVPKRFVRAAALRIGLLQAADFAIDKVAQAGKCLLGMMQIDLRERHYPRKVNQGELLVSAVAVRPHVPDKKRPNDFGIFRKETLKVKNVAVVERSHDANVVQGGRVALEVLNCIRVSVEHVRVRANYLRVFRNALKHIVVISIYASNHVFAEARAEVVGKGYLLAF